MKKILLLLLFISSNSYAFSFQDGPNLNKLMPLLEVKGNAVKWEIITSTKEKQECTKSDGLTNCYTSPIYSEEIKELDNKEIVLMGYMFPLEQSQEQSNFLLGPYPPNCPFEYHTGPSHFVEIKAKKPIKFSFDPISIKGKFLVKYNKDTEVFYYLEEAKET